MNRFQITTKMIDYLEDKINCHNVINFLDKSKISQSENKNKLIIKSIPLTFKIIDNDKEIKNLFEIFDFMTEANYTGFEYFPYLYGVLDCSDQNKIYVFYENFDSNLIDILNNMEHQSEWYDIVFQMIIINYYIQNINNYKYDNGIPQNHLCRKLPKPIYQDYHIYDIKFTINHKYLIVLWNITNMELITDENKNNITTNIDHLIKYINEHKDKIKIMPSERILKLLNDIQNNYDDTLSILDKYYNATN